MTNGMNYTSVCSASPGRAGFFLIFNAELAKWALFHIVGPILKSFLKSYMLFKQFQRITLRKILSSQILTAQKNSLLECLPVGLLITRLLHYITLDTRKQNTFAPHIFHLKYYGYFRIL